MATLWRRSQFAGQHQSSVSHAFPHSLAEEDFAVSAWKPIVDISQRSFTLPSAVDPENAYAIQKKYSDKCMGNRQ
jgi:hypothetical protein